MIAAVYVLYVLNCLFLVLVVLLQAGKGDSMGAVFGGASNTLLGNRGAATFLSKLTVLSAVLFMVLSIVLAYHSSAPSSRVADAEPEPTPTPGATATTTEDDDGAGQVEEAPLLDDTAVAPEATEGTGTVAPQVAEGTGTEGTGQPLAPPPLEGTGTP